MFNETTMELIKLGVDHINGVTVANFSNGSRNDAIRDKFFEIMGTDKWDVMSYNAHKNEIFEIMKEIFKQTISDSDGLMSQFYNTFVEEDHIEWGDSKEIELENDAYLTVGKISGNNLDLDRQRMDAGASIPMKTDAYYIKVYEFFKRFMTGRMDFAKLAEKMNTSIKKFKDDAVAECFKSGVEGLPQGWYYEGSYNKNEIQNVFTNVTASNDGSDVIAVGTKGALNKLQGITVANLSDAEKLEYNTKGYVRNWEGYTCVELPTVFKANSLTEFAFDNDTVYVLPVGAKPVKVLTEGDPIVTETNEIADRKDMTKEVCTIFNVGFMFIMNRLIGGVKITG